MLLTNGRLLNKDFVQSRVRKNDFNLNIRMSKLKNKEDRLSKLYDIKKYLDPENYAFPEDMNELIPESTPVFLDNGERYVERIARALSYFKQCALIGPSGTGKNSHCLHGS